MSGHTIIAINREYGSDGRKIGMLVAEKLGIKCHGDDIVGLAARYSGIEKEAFINVDERPTDSLLFMIAENTFSIGSSAGSYKSSHSSDKLFTKQSEVIKRFAATEDCVIMGRCGNYILRDEPGCIAVFITSDMDFRIDTVMKREEVSRREAIKRIKTMDKRRSRYYGYYSGRDWDACDTYDLLVNPGKIGIEKAADVICSYVNIVSPIKNDIQDE